MQGLERNRTAWANHWPESARINSTVVAFAPIAAASHRSPFGNARTASDFGAEIIRFQPRRIALATPLTAGRQAKGAAANFRHSTANADDYRQRMLINLLASAWLAVLGTGGYFALSGLLQMP